MPRELHRDLWVVERPLAVLGAELGARMTVIRLADGGLVLVSPVRPDDRLREALASLGPVVALVAPNRFHHLYLARAAREWPSARVLVAPGLPGKRPDLRCDEVLGDEPPSLWAGQLDQLVFRAAPALSEVAFRHLASGTLVLTDLAFNLRRAPNAWTRIAARLYGVWNRFGPSLAVRLAIRDRAAARAEIDAILEWGCDRVVVAHGDVLATGGVEALAAAFAFLGPRRERA